MVKGDHLFQAALLVSSRGDFCLPCLAWWPRQPRKSSLLTLFVMIFLYFVTLVKYNCKFLVLLKHVWKHFSTSFLTNMSQPWVGVRFPVPVSLQHVHMYFFPLFNIFLTLSGMQLPSAFVGVNHETSFHASICI